VAASANRIARCAGCGRDRPCYHAASERPLCNSCYRREHIKRWKIEPWSKPVAVCSRCGTEGPAWFARTDHPLCSTCHRREKPRADWRGVLAVCAQCQRERLCWPRGGRPLCGRCVRGGKPRSLWKVPVAVCVVCNLERPCYFARTGRPKCSRCRRRELHPPRFATVRECLACGQLARMRLRLGDDGECELCSRRRMRTRIDCARCGHGGRPSARDPDRCERCAGEAVRQVCVGCGAEELNHTDRRCARCTLKRILDRLAAGGDPVAVNRLAPYLDALANGPQPWTTLKWIARSRGYETVVELATGARAISHRALDEVDRGMTTSFLRAALVSHGVLERRGEQTARLERAARAALPQLAAGEDRAQIHAFATWQLQHDLARRERRGQTTRTSARSSVSYLRAAVKLAQWAHERDLTLDRLRQEDLDRWLAEGSAATAMIHPFLKWAHRGGLIAPLTAARPIVKQHTRPLDDDTRLAYVRRLLTDHDLDLRDRVAGCLVLLYAQPVSRLLMLTTDHVTTSRDRIAIRLGNTPLELPEPLGALTATLARERPGRASTATGGSAPAWLFQGMRVGTPLDEAHFRGRLKRLAIAPLSARTAAQTNLAALLPPTIVADLIGVSPSAASNWYRLAGGEWNRYAAHGAARYDAAKATSC